MSESSALDVSELLQAKGADVRYHDPYTPRILHHDYDLHGETDLGAALAAADCAMGVTSHSTYGWGDVVRRAQLLVDTRKATERLGKAAKH